MGCSTRRDISRRWQIKNGREPISSKIDSSIDDLCRVDVISNRLALAAFSF
jgi:hypothetical protein